MGPTSDEPLVIDCDDCAMQATTTCDDCIVTFLCADEADDDAGYDGHRSQAGSAVVIDVAEVRALRLLAESGLAPPLRHRRHAG